MDGEPTAQAVEEAREVATVPTVPTGPAIQPSDRTLVGAGLAGAAPFVVLGAGFAAGWCATDAIQPCFYPFAGATLAGGAMGAVGPVLLLSGAERDRKALGGGRHFSAADGGMIALGVSGALLVLAPMVDPRSVEGPLLGATVAYGGALTLAGVQLVENQGARIRATRSDNSP